MSMKEAAQTMQLTAEPKASFSGHQNMVALRATQPIENLLLTISLATLSESRTARLTTTFGKTTPILAKPAPIIFQAARALL